MLRSVTYCGYDVNISFVVGLDVELRDHFVFSNRLYNACEA
jgi:hypothetical protein